VKPEPEAVRSTRTFSLSLPCLIASHRQIEIVAAVQGPDGSVGKEAVLKEAAVAWKEVVGAQGGVDDEVDVIEGEPGIGYSLSASVDRDVHA